MFRDRLHNRLLLVAAASAALIVLSWLAGFLWFASTIPRTITDTSSRTDAIVVLTGGSERLATGIELLSNNLADRLFVSGVGPGARLADLIPAELFSALAARISLGDDAVDTIGNAAETAAWARANGISSIRVVTAAYHMRRSLAEFHAAMPDIATIAHPVFPATVRADWWRAPGTAALIAAEYTKFLLGQIRIAVTPTERTPS
jgi:uncharacterized SAM-binding protein YcdF (DUF218 family)